MEEINLEQLKEMQKELFKKQCDLDIQKAMLKHFIKKEQSKQLIITDVVSSFCPCGKVTSTKDCNCPDTNFTDDDLH